jgi:hypothetical protein
MRPTGRRESAVINAALRLNAKTSDELRSLLARRGILTPTERAGARRVLRVRGEHSRTIVVGSKGPIDAKVYE